MITKNKWEELSSFGDIHHQKGYGKMKKIFLKKCYLMVQVQRDDKNNW